MKNLLLFGLLILVFVSTNATAQKRKKSFVKTKKETVKIVSDDERRKEVEKLLLAGIYQHDGSGELAYIGTIESVPALLKVLEDNPPFIEKPEDDEEIPEVLMPGEIKTLSKIPQAKREPKIRFICTYAHALSALRKITRRDFILLADWSKWWEDYRNKETTK